MPIVIEEVIAHVAPEPRPEAPPTAAAAEPRREHEPLSMQLRREERRQDRLRAD